MSGTPDVVLDASVVLAFLFGEPGGEQVRPLLDSAVISAVNMSEVLGRLVRAGMRMEQAQAAFSCLGLAVVPFGELEAVVSARIAARESGAAWLSLGDRACLGMAGTLGLPAVTADRQWAGLELGIEVRLIR